MFDCGIHTTMEELSNQIRKDQENFIVSAVQELYVDIDKEKLEKCLNDSKSFYDEGYKEGYDNGFNEAMVQMKYQCGPFIYDLPEDSCVFCQNADIT